MALGDYQWHGQQWSDSGCPGTYNPPGWYKKGSYTPITTTYKNPSTGSVYTWGELDTLLGGGTTPATGTTPTVPTTSQLEAGSTTPTATGGNINPYTGKPFTTADLSGMGVATVKDFWNFYNQGQIQNGQYVGPAGVVGTGGWGENAPTAYNIPSTPASSPLPTSALENLAVPQAPTLPPYKPTAELEQLSTQVGGAISGIIEQGGIGMGEDTKEQIFLREAEIINANTAQANKNLEDKMAAQGLSNSGMAFSEGMKLASKSTIAMANVMRDVEIQDALMKVASYQNALGLGVQFLSYLSEESWRQYQPTLYQWQAQVDMYKLAITQAYTQQNYALAHQYDMELAQFTADTNIQMAEMELEAANAQAASQGAGSIFGTLLGWLIPGS